MILVHSLIAINGLQHFSFSFSFFCLTNSRHVYFSSIDDFDDLKSSRDSTENSMCQRVLFMLYAFMVLTQFMQHRNCVYCQDCESVTTRSTSRLVSHFLVRLLLLLMYLFIMGIIIVIFRNIILEFIKRVHFINKALYLNKSSIFLNVHYTNHDHHKTTIQISPIISGEGYLYSVLHDKQVIAIQVLILFCLVIVGIKHRICGSVKLVLRMLILATVCTLA